MRAALVPALLLVAAWAGCVEEGDGEGTTTTTSTNTSATTTTSTNTSATTTTTTTQPPAPTCRIWIDSIDGRILRAGADGRHANWQIDVGIEGGAPLGASVAVVTVQLDDGEPRDDSEQEGEEETNLDGVASHTRSTGSGQGTFRLTVQDIDHTADGEDCLYDAAMNNMTSADVTLTG